MSKQFPYFQQYKVYSEKNLYLKGASDFHSTPSYLITSKIINIIETEEPIHRDLVKKRVAGLFNVRLGKKVNQRVEVLISSAIYRRIIFPRGDFIWANESYTTTVRSHPDGYFRRKIEEIAPEEIALALITIVENSVSIHSDDLIKEVAIVFGFKATENISEKIRIIYHKLLSQKYFKKVNGRVSIDYK